MEERRAGKHAPRRAIGAAALAALLALLLSSCGGNSIDQNQARKLVGTKLASLQERSIGTASQPKKISCPSGVEIKRGKTFTCSVSYDDGYTAAVRVHIKDNKGTLSVAPRDFVVKRKVAQIKDKGDFVLNVRPGQGADAGVEIVGRQSATDIVKFLNNTFALPRNVRVIFGDGLDGPAYDPSTHTIYMPYSFADEVFALFTQTKQYTQAENVKNVSEVLKFVLLHEATHALIHELNIPVVGREEDAADGFAATILASEGGGDTALASAEFWDLSAASTGNPTLQDYADVHSLDRQRFFQILCLVYGSNPNEYSGLVGDFLPQARAEGCPAEYAQSLDSWTKLLDPYLKKAIAPKGL
jgi:hypothetical protein